MTETITYTYRNESGDVTYSLQRDGEGPGKTFAFFGADKQPLPNPIPPEMRILYRLPELLASPVSETVYIAEGEKDTDTLVALGLVATTMPCGCHGGWLPRYGRWLKGRHVVILPDNDGPGKRHALAVFESLAGVAASVSIIPLGGASGLDDVTTWCFRQADPAVNLRSMVRESRYSAAGVDVKSSPRKCHAISLIAAAPLNTATKLMLMFLADSLYAGEPKYASMEELADDCAIHRVTGQRCLRALRGLGVVDSLPRGRGDIRWDLLAAIVNPTPKPDWTKHGSAKQRRQRERTYRRGELQ